MSNFTEESKEPSANSANFNNVNEPTDNFNIVNEPSAILTNTESRLDTIEQRLDTIEQLLTQQAQLADNSFASQGPLNFSDLVVHTNASFQSMSDNTTMEVESNVSTQSFGAPVGGKNKTKSNKKKKSKNQTKRKRKV